MKTSGSILATMDQGVLRITLRRPPLNILNQEAIREICGALETVRNEPSLKAVLFSAEGKAFSSGVEIADHLPEKVAETLASFRRIFQWV